MFWDIVGFKKAYLDKFVEIEGKTIDEGTPWEKYRSLVLLIKEEISMSWARTNNTYSERKEKQVYYFSMEFLIGRLLSYYLINLGIEEVVRKGLSELDIDLRELIIEESDAGLGNGGLGRLAACFLDSMAFLGIPGHGNGIRYKYGLFQQKIINGFQVEVPDIWLNNGYPWEIRKLEKAVIVKFKGNVRTEDINGKLTFIHENYEPIRAVPYDIPIVSFDSLNNINNLRLWSAETVHEGFDLASFNLGDYSQAVSDKSEAEAISYILYPEDSTEAGRELRLKQEYFFVAAGLGAIVRRYKKKNGSLIGFAHKIAVHINDTHPALCIPELMRILIDEEGMGWEEAWKTTVNVISYTNHTILPEALEKWPINIVKYLCPRIYMIIEEIDRRYREEIAWKYPGMEDLINRTAILQDGQVWMANLAVIGSHSVNGVSKLHTKILEGQVLKDFFMIFPYKFSNKTNGVSHRRFLLGANPGLSQLISRGIGDEWIKDSKELEKLISYKDDSSFLESLQKVKYDNKCRLAALIKERMDIVVDPSSIFDVQVKRFHAYKRQLLNIFKILDLYHRLKDNPQLPMQPCTFIFGGKVAPGYHYAKIIIKLIHTLAEKVNGDQEIKDKIKIIFLEDFNVSLAELIYPAADISEQISAASREASGTGNMKFMLNGAITLGTLDGANEEIYQLVGKENMAIFGLTADQVMNYYQLGGYRSFDEYQKFPRLKRVVDQLINGFLGAPGGEFSVIHEALLRNNDHFFVLKDFPSYLEAWQGLLSLYEDQEGWAKASLVNIAKGGAFSSDQTIKGYAEEIWGIPYRKRSAQEILAVNLDKAHQESSKKSFPESYNEFNELSGICGLDKFNEVKEVKEFKEFMKELKRKQA